MTRLLILSFIGLVAYKSGILILFFRETLDGSGAGIDVLTALFVPIPLTSFVLFMWPVKKPDRHILPSLIVMALPMLLHQYIGILALAMVVASGIWFGVAIKSHIALSSKDWIRPLSSIVIAGVIVGEAFGFLLSGYGFDSIYPMVVLLLIAILMSIELKDHGLLVPKHESLEFDWKVFISAKSFSIIILFIMLGGSEPVLIGRLDQAGQTYAYGLFLCSRSLLTALALSPLFFKSLRGVWLTVALVSFLGVIYGPMWYSLICYATLGASSAVMVREYDVHFLTLSNNPPKTSAAIYLVLSSIMAVSVVVGGMI